MEFIIGILILILIVLGEVAYYLINKNNKPIDNKASYTKKIFLTDNELFFYDCFKKIDSKYITIPQVNLSTIIKKEGYHKYQNELYRNLDFCIFDQNFNVLLAIEINDNSHKMEERRDRDQKVKKILNESNIELLTFNINYPNTENSVINRVNEALKNK